MSHLRAAGVVSTFCVVAAACGGLANDSMIDAGQERRDAGVRDAGVADAGLEWPPYVIDGGYARFALDGWPIAMEVPLISTQRGLGERVVTLLRNDLRQIAAVVPSTSLGQLRGVTLFVLVDEPLVPGGAYHPSAQWLTDHQRPVEWAKNVTLGNAANYLTWTQTQPAMVLHELAHAWHDQVLGSQDADVLVAYGHALDAGTYDSVDYAGGGKRRAYALTDAMEYFAETSEAWFWRNDFKPFVRAELEAIDSEGAALMQLKWQAP